MAIGEGEMISGDSGKKIKFSFSDFNGMSINISGGNVRFSSPISQSREIREEIETPKVIGSKPVKPIMSPSRPVKPKIDEKKPKKITDQKSSSGEEDKDVENVDVITGDVGKSIKLSYAEFMGEEVEEVKTKPSKKKESEPKPKPPTKKKESEPKKEEPKKMTESQDDSIISGEGGKSIKLSFDDFMAV